MLKKVLFPLLIFVTILTIRMIDQIAARVLLSFVIFAWFYYLELFAGEKLFSQNWINWPLGHLASMICLVPFFQWKTIHDHPEHQVNIQRKWIPPFNVVAYSVKNFWNIKRLWGLFQEKQKRKKFIISMLAMNTMLMGIIPQVPQFWIKFGPSYLGFLILAELYLQNLKRPIRLSLNLKQE